MGEGGPGTLRWLVPSQPVAEPGWLLRSVQLACQGRVGFTAFGGHQGLVGGDPTGGEGVRSFRGGEQNAKGMAPRPQRPTPTHTLTLVHRHTPHVHLTCTRHKHSLNRPPPLSGTPVFPDKLRFLIHPHLHFLTDTLTYTRLTHILSQLVVEGAREILPFSGSSSWKAVRSAAPGAHWDLPCGSWGKRPAPWGPLPPHTQAWPSGVPRPQARRAAATRGSGMAPAGRVSL